MTSTAGAGVGPVPRYQPDPGSFRDPTNRVLVDGERVLRGLDATARDDFEALQGTDLFRDQSAVGKIIATARLTDVPPSLASEGWAAVLEHERVPVISYPYEWSFAMLKDAALLQLDLALAALDEGLITKDATPYNVQFVGARPTHIDVGSFERLTPGEPWFGYRQFCDSFLNPLLLTAYRDIHHQPALRGSLRGVPATACAATLRLRHLLRPSVLVHVGLEAGASRRQTAPGKDVRQELKAAGFGPKVIAAQLTRLRKLVTRLEWRSKSSVWSDYSDRQHYVDDDLQRKADFVARVAADRRRSQVLDLGANDGYFSDLVLPHTDYVVAVDHDALVIDRLYRQLRERSESRILPLVMDLADPSGGVGWRARERTSFVSRVRPDLVLCLALIHHLAISESIPLDEFVGFLADFDAEVVLEFPMPDDPMVELLLAQKKDRGVTQARYTREILEAALAPRFDTLEVVELDTRRLYRLAPRGNA